MRLTFLTTAELTALATDFGIESVGEGANKVQDVGVSAGSFEFLFSDLVSWLGSTEEDVEANGTSVQGL